MISKVYIRFPRTYLRHQNPSPPWYQTEASSMRKNSHE
uniref:Uncharacterized protein n=1 Tax=Arundo donax TaxID=35708 RepID=A0A0A9GYI7_ARUDO